MNTKHLDEIKKLSAWSTIDPKPVLSYIKEYDDTLVVWNNVIMNEKMALMLAISILGKPPTPKMMIELFRSYKNLYITGFFGEQNWDAFFYDFDTEEHASRNLVKFMRSYMNAHLEKYVKDRNITEILSWFNC